MDGDADAPESGTGGGDPSGKAFEGKGEEGSVPLVSGMEQGIKTVAGGDKTKDGVGFQHFRLFDHGVDDLPVEGRKRRDQSVLLQVGEGGETDNVGQYDVRIDE